VHRFLPVLAACLLAGCSSTPVGDTRIDAELAAEISRIKAIDNHAHPVRPVGAGEAGDKDYDALPVESLDPASDPVGMRADSSALVDAHKAISKGDKTSAEYAVKVLDQLGIDIMVANRVSMGPGLPPSRFLWAAYADALMYPLPTAGLVHDSDHKAFFAPWKTGCCSATIPNPV
jgi:hypothetical protein